MTFKRPDAIVPRVTYLKWHDSADAPTADEEYVARLRAFSERLFGPVEVVRVQTENCEGVHFLKKKRAAPLEE